MDWINWIFDNVFWFVGAMIGIRLWNITSEILAILKITRNKMEDNGGTTRRRRATPVQRPGR